MILKKEEKELISLEIAELEKLSSAEIVAVITQKSSNYKYAALMLSIFCVFLMSFILYFIRCSVFSHHDLERCCSVLIPSANLSDASLFSCFFFSHGEK